MREPWAVKGKVCLVGEIAVGKTSLLRRFSLGTFDEAYSTTLGVSISKKTVRPPHPAPDDPSQVDLILFDIMGQRSLREPLLEAYFKGAQALLAVWDITRPGTLAELRNWIRMAWKLTGPVPVVIATNKVDLSPDRTLDADALDAVAREFGGECLTTSAKTGENVETAFERLAAGLVRRAESAPPPKRGAGDSRTLESIARGLVESTPKKP